MLMPRTSRPMHVFPIWMRTGVIAAIADVTPNMRRLTIGSDELDAARVDGLDRPPFRSIGFDDHVKLVIPRPGHQLPVLGEQQESTFAWNREVFSQTRDYTVRRWDPEAATFDVDVVRHDSGLAADWAYACHIGHRIDFAGPKMSSEVVADVDWHFLAGDETALPAIARWLEEAPARTRARVYIEVPTGDDRQEIDTNADADITWLIRGSVPAGHSRLLLESVQQTEFPPGRVFAWCAGEALTMAPIRRHLRKDVGLPKADVEVVGYWRRASSPSDTAATTQNPDTEAVGHSASGEDESDSGEDQYSLTTALHEMTELAPPIVTRVAATLGIGTHIEAGLDTVEKLSTACQIPPERLQPLLDAMCALDLADVDGRVYRNTPMGGLLTEDSAVAALSLDDPANQPELSLLHLLHTMRSGEPALGGQPGRTERSWRRQDPAVEQAFAERGADALTYDVDPISNMPEISTAESVCLAGDGVDYLASELAARYPSKQFHVCADDANCPAADVAFLVGCLEGLSDERAAAVLTGVTAQARTVVLLEASNDHAADDDHIAEHGLVNLVSTGVPLRSTSELQRLLVKAGCATVDKRILGWGFGLRGTVIIGRI